MKNALIIHGTSADHTCNWFPWLSNELQKNGYKVWVPDLPHSEPEHFIIFEYSKLILQHWNFSQESIIVGHSGGTVVALNLLENFPKEIIIDKTVLVSA